MSVADVTALGWRKLKEVFRVERRGAGTPGQVEQERETAVSLGLMAQAAAAGPDMSDEQAIFLSASTKGMRDRIEVLLGNPRRTLPQERELVMIQRELARLEGREAAPVAAPSRIRGLMATAAANPLLAVLSHPATWVAAAFCVPAAWGSVQTWRLNNAKGDLREARASLRATEEALVTARATQERLAQAVRDADTQTRQTAETIEAERARRVRAEREARRVRDALEQARAGGVIDYGFGGVRDAGGAAPGPGGDRPAGGHPR